MYHVSADVLGVLIARVSGQSLGTFLRERIFDPLGMKDTSFYVPAEKMNRFPVVYFPNRQTNGLDVFDDVANSEAGLLPQNRVQKTYHKKGRI
jgi:CubicO group peptidase (beta-lactamase class C family)